MNQVLCTRSEHKAYRQAVCNLYCRAYARDGDVEIIDRLGPIAAVVLDRAADHASFGGEPDRLGRCLGLVRETVLEIGIDREVRRLSDHPAIGDYFGPAHSAIGAAEHVGQSQTGGGERLEARSCQQSCRASIPRIGNNERAGPLVQCAERGGFLCLSAHVGVSFIC
jgi:hypothetical protein